MAPSSINMNGLTQILIALLVAGIILNVLLYSTHSEIHNQVTKDLIYIGATTTTAERVQTTTNGYLTATLIGGLGNQMFIYSSLYALAKKTNRIPQACTGYNISRLFPNLTIPILPGTQCEKRATNTTNATIPTKAKYLSQINHAHYFDPGLFQKIIMSNDSRVHICCYLQNLGFFMEYLDDLKREFSLSYVQREKAYVYLNQQIGLYKGKKSFQNELEIVGVHVRRGDLARKEWIAAPPPSYFHRAMEYFRRKYKKQVLFVVSTDDMKWCHENLKGTDVVFTADSGRKSREEDFSIQVCCNHTIVSMGSFGCWIGFLTSGEVTVYKDFMNKSSTSYHWHLPDQRYPITWKVM